MKSLERDFEKFKAGPLLPTQDRLHATLSSNGKIYLNKKLYRVLQKPAAVALYYSRERDVIAVEPANPRFPQSFPVLECRMGYRIGAGPFVGHFHIRTKNTVRFVRPDMTDSGALLLDLRNTVNVTERRSSRNGK